TDERFNGSDGGLRARPLLARGWLCVVLADRAVGSFHRACHELISCVDRARIELLLARGASRRHIGERFNCSPDAVWRHWRNGHVPEHVKSQLAIHALKPGETLDKLVQDESIGLLENLQRIRATLYASFDAAAEVGDRQAVALLAARLHENLRLAAT